MAAFGTRNRINLSETEYHDLKYKSWRKSTGLPHLKMAREMTTYNVDVIFIWLAQFLLFCYA